MAEIKFSTGQGNSMNIDGKKTQKWTVVILIIVGIVILLFNCFTIVDEGFIGVRYRFGAIVNDNLGAGLRLKIPFIEEIRPVEVRDLIYEFRGDAYTRDTQPVNELIIKVTYRYDTTRLSDLIRGVGIDNVEARYLVPNTQNIAKNVIGQVVAERLVQERTEVRDKIRADLSVALEPFGILVTEVAIENLSFSNEFEAAIQNKVIAEQRALEAENRTREREHEADQRVIAAQAEADSVLVKAEADAAAIALIQAQLTASPLYIEYLKIINWNGILPQVIGDGVNPFVVLGADNNTMNNNNRPANQPAEFNQ
jgi:regulator of protease activity HflC (stomatin/prohibitin superfamily)